MNEIIEFIRAIVRPVLTLSGWGVLLYIVTKVIVTHINQGMANTIVTLFLGSLATFIGFWFAERGWRK